MLYRFQVMTDYWSDFRYWPGSASLLSPLLGWFPVNIRISFKN